MDQICCWIHDLLKRANPKWSEAKCSKIQRKIDLGRPCWALKVRTETIKCNSAILIKIMSSCNSVGIGSWRSSPCPFCRPQDQVKANQIVFESILWSLWNLQSCTSSFPRAGSIQAFGVLERSHALQRDHFSEEVVCKWNGCKLFILHRPGHGKQRNRAKPNISLRETADMFGPGIIGTRRAFQRMCRCSGMEGGSARDWRVTALARGSSKLRDQFQLSLNPLAEERDFSRTCKVRVPLQYHGAHRWLVWKAFVHAIAGHSVLRADWMAQWDAQAMDFGALGPPGEELLKPFTIHLNTCHPIYSLQGPWYSGETKFLVVSTWISGFPQPSVLYHTVATWDRGRITPCMEIPGLEERSLDFWPVFGGAAWHPQDLAVGSWSTFEGPGVSRSSWNGLKIWSCHFQHVFSMF